MHNTTYCLILGLSWHQCQQTVSILINHNALCEEANSLMTTLASSSQGWDSVQIITIHFTVAAS